MKLIKKFLRSVVILLLILLVLIIESEDIQMFLDRNIFYAKKYEKIVKLNAEKFGVDENLIYAVIQNESNFFPYAKSKSDAKGLMQITPITFDHAKKVLNFDSDDFYDKNINIMVGTWYLSYLSKIYDDERFVIMAYNAGPENINTWQNSNFLKSDDHNTWNIPFTETRAYLTKVLNSKQKFEKIENKNIIKGKNNES